MIEGTHWVDYCVIGVEEGQVATLQVELTSQVSTESTDPASVPTPTSLTMGTRCPSSGPDAGSTSLAYSKGVVDFSRHLQRFCDIEEI